MKWREAARRSLEQLLKVEEDSEAATVLEFPLTDDMQPSSEGRSQPMLDKERKALRRRRKVLACGYLREGDTHCVWKGKARTPLLADIALVALRKKREKDLLERQRYLKDRVAATQAALKVQTEILLGEEEEDARLDEEGEERQEGGADLKKKQ